MSECRCDEKAVKGNIDWLEKYKYIKYVPFLEMNDEEKRYYQSDNCTILRNIKSYNEIEHLEINKKNMKKLISFQIKINLINIFLKWKKNLIEKNFIMEKHIL